MGGAGAEEMSMAPAWVVFDPHELMLDIIEFHKRCGACNGQCGLIVVGIGMSIMGCSTKAYGEHDGCWFRS